MKKNTVGIIIVVTGLLILISIIYIVFFYRFSEPTPSINLPREEGLIKVITPEVKPSAENTTGKQENTTPAPEAEKITLPKDVPARQKDVTEKELERMAMSFAERFGSFSNQSNYDNIVDLRIFMSPAMKVWADNFVKDARARSNPTDIYYGVTTKAISLTVNKFDNAVGQAEILVKTQRREATGTSVNANNFFQDILIKFTREDSVWKIDSAFWRPR